MTDFATQSDVINALAASGSLGGRFSIQKSSITAVAGNWYSGWTEAGVPAAGANPTTWETLTKAKLGAYNNNMVNGGTATLRLLQGAIAQANAGQSKWIIDRIGQMAGMSGTSTGAQSTGANGNTGAWSGARCLSDYSDVEWYLEWYGATGSTSVTATIAVTYNDASTGNCTLTIPASVPAFRIMQIQPPAGTVGKYIKSVDTVTLSASTLTAGNFGVTALRRLASFMSLTANYVDKQDYAALGMPKIGDDACLNAIYWTTTTSTGITLGTLVVGAH